MAIDFNTYLFTLGLAIAIILLLISIAKLNEHRYKQKIKLLQLNLLECEQKSIQSQMNPHFIFNSLNTIKHYVYINNKTKADFAIDCFSIFLRKYIDYSSQNYVRIADEIKLLETYMSLEKLRANDLFETEITVDEAVKNVYIPTQLIQPFVENAIKHGVLKSTNKCTIKLQFIIENNYIICKVEDDGIGLESSKRSESKKSNYESKGIELIQNKIKIIKQITGSEILLSIENSSNEIGTIVTLKIPMRNDKSNYN